MKKVRPSAVSPSQMAITRWTDPSAGLFDRTPFGAFLFCLSEESPAILSPNEGEETWSGPPIPRMLAAGLWPLVLRLAERMDTSEPGTETQATPILQRLGRMLDAGLVLAYPTPVAAAHAFREQALRPIERRLASLPEVPVHPHALWTEPIAEFFGKMVATAIQAHAEIRDLWSECQRVSVRASWRTEAVGQSVESSLSQVDLSSPAKGEEAFASLSRRLREIIPVLQEEIEYARAFAELPVRMKDLPSYLNGLIWRVESWISTQLLLAAANAADAEFLKKDSYVAGITSLSGATDEEILTRLRKRLAKRGYRPSAPSWDRIRRVAMPLLDTLRQRDLTLDMQATLDVLLDLEPGDVPLTPAEALDLASGTEVAVSSAVSPDDGQGSDRRNRIVAEIVRQVPWETIETDQALLMLHNRRVSPVQLARHAGRMSPLIRQEVAAALVHLVMDTPKARRDQELITALLVMPDAMLPFRFILDHRKSIPEGQAIAQFAALVARWDTRNGDERPLTIYRSFAALCDLAMRAEPHALREWFGLSGNRRHFCEYLYGTSIGDETAAVDRASVQRFAKTLGADVWTRVLLGLAHLDRRGLVEDPRPEPLFPWAVSLAKRATFALERQTQTLAFRHETLAKRARAVSERDIFRWLYADLPDADARWEAYAARLKRCLKAASAVSPPRARPKPRS